MTLATPLYVPPLPPPFNSYHAHSPTPPPSTHVLPASPRTRRRQGLAALPAFSFANPFKPEMRKVQFDSITTIGRRKLPERVIDDQFRPLQHKPIFFQQIKDGINAINDWLRDAEFACSHVMLAERYLFESKVLTLVCVEPLLDSIQLVPVDSEGKPDPSGRIVTRESTICRALGIRIGEVFTWKAAGVARLMALRLFTFGDAEIKSVASDKVRLVLKLCERRTRSAEPGAGLTSDGRIYGDFTLVDDNFMGRAQQIRLDFEKRVDSPNPAVGFAFEDMRIGAFIPLSFRLRAYRDCNAVMSSVNETEADHDSTSTSTVRPNLPLRYEKDRDGILLDLGYRPKDSTLIFSFTPMFEHIYANRINTSESSGHPRPFVQAVLQTGVTHTTRRPIDLPRGGHLLRIEHTFGSNLTPVSSNNSTDDSSSNRSNSDRLFHRVKVKLINYFAVASRSSIAARIIAGFGSDNLPSHEQRALGGHGSVRGFRYGELGRLKSYGTGRIELRVPLGSNGRDQLDDPNTSKLANDQGEDDTSRPPAQQQPIEQQSEKILENDQDKLKVDSNNNFMAPSLFDRLPALVGVLFTDTAFTDVREPQHLGSSVGLGLRVGGVIAIDWISTMDGRPSRVHFSLVDRAM